MSNQAGSSRLDTALKLLLITFVSLVAFSTGVYVGKEMSSSDFQLKAMEADFNAQKTAAAKNKDLDVPEKDALVDEEVSQLSEKLVGDEKEKLVDDSTAKGEERKVASEGETKTEKTSEKTAEKAPAKKEAAKVEAKKPAVKAVEKKEQPKHDARAESKEETASNNTEKPISKGLKADALVADDDVAPVKPAKSKVNLGDVQKTAERIARSQAPTSESVATTEKSESSRTPTSLPKSIGTATGAGFTVQIASYPSEDEAKKHIDDLIKKGYPAFPIEAKVDGKVWYRVSLGNFKTQKEAVQYRMQLTKDSEIKKAFVAKITN